MTVPAAGVWMLRYSDDDNCDGDPISLHRSRQGAEAELAKYTDPGRIHIEPWPVRP